jgi:hypothetical protein
MLPIKYLVLKDKNKTYYASVEPEDGATIARLLSDPRQRIELQRFIKTVKLGPLLTSPRDLI